MKLTKTLGLLGLIIFIFVNINRYSYYYLLRIIGNSDNYEFTPINYLTTSYFLTHIGERSLYSIQHIHLHKRFYFDNERHLNTIQNLNEDIKIITVT